MKDMKGHRGELATKFLEFISEGAHVVGDVAAIFSAPYGTSLRGMDYHIAQSRRARERTAYKRSEQKVFSDLLYRLERDGLISASGRGNSKMVSITELGVKKLKWFYSAKPVPAHYPVLKDNLLKIVMFDIPERERRKRAWLRSALKNLEFRMIQQSVWAGKIKIPKEFLAALKDLHLVSYVQIFAVTKRGSLREM